MDQETVDYEVAVIGAGFAGLGMAAALRRAGRDDFVIFERERELGGTWWVNTYPGCACDVPSHLYSFSFAPNPDWGRMFSPQPEILDYLRHCAERYGLQRFTRFETEITSCRYDEAAGRWRLTSAGGDTWSCRFLVAGIGPLSRPSIPDLPGLGDFGGEVFHSQQWNHDFDLEGRTVAVVGTGASAVQFVPRIAPQARRLDLYQRTPPWIVPKPDRPIGVFEKRLYRRLPALQRLYRGFIYTVMEARVVPFIRHPGLFKLVEAQALRHMREQIHDPALREKLTPSYRLGCKRILPSNDYYPAIARDNVELVTDAIRSIDQHGIVAGDGTHRAADAIILGTGFRATDPVPAGLIYGRGGRDIREAWAEGPEAYLGTTVAGFPNLFVLVGPNTGLGHTSLVYMIESQVRYVLSALEQMGRQGLGTFEVRPDVQRSFNQRLQQKMQRTVWIRGGCRSWYKTDDGKNVTLWPGSTLTYRRLTRRFRLADYDVGR